MKNRKEWRAWLARNHRTAPEVWLIYYKKNSNKPRIPYNDAVEEALCYGWIDSTVKSIDKHRYAQRFSPRRKKSQLSELNKERVRRLIKAKKMTRFGLAAIEHHLAKGAELESTRTARGRIPTDILQAIKADPVVWRNFQRFPESYRRIRVGWIDSARVNPTEFKKRLRYFLKMTAKNKQFGMVR